VGRFARYVLVLVAGLLAANGGTASAAVPASSSGGGYTVRIGADSTTAAIGETWEDVSRAGGRLRGGTNGFGAYFVIGNLDLDPQFGDREGWRLTLPSGVRLGTFSLDVRTGAWVGHRWTSGLRYTVSARDGDGALLGEPFLSCQPTPTANDCPTEFKLDASTVFKAPAGTRRIELAVECVLPEGCSRFANPDGGPGGNEYAVVEGGTFNLVDDTAPALTTGFGEIWTDAARWFHNSEAAAAGMGATDNTGLSRFEWYVDGTLAYDTSGVTSVFALPCDYSHFRPCSDTTAQFRIASSLFTIPDGLHELTVVARDAGGNASPALRRTFRVDDSAPPKVSVSVREGSDLRDPGPWHLDFTAPPELDGAPLELAWYRLCAASNANDCTEAEPFRAGIDGLSPGTHGSVEVSPPSEGDWTVQMWLVDRAGNGSEANASDPVLIRYGQTAPVADPKNPPTLSGDFTDGSSVRVSASGFRVAGRVDYAFQWQRCDGSGSGCADVAGATAQDYVLVHADAGHRMRARVVASNAKGSDSALTAASAPVALLPPRSGTATLSGPMRAGEELRVVDVAFDGTPPFGFEYAWLRCSSGVCDSIPDAHDASYALADDDVGQTIRAFVTASNPAGSSTAEAARFGGAGSELVAPAPPRSVVAPGVPGGERQVGKTLTADDGQWAGTRPMTFTYAWQRCAGATGGCTAIAGATARSYELATADAGRMIRVLVSASNGGEPVGPVASARTTAIEPAPAAEEPSAGAPDEPRAEPPAAPPPSVTPPSGPPALTPPAGVEDLSKIPGNLVGPATCKVVRVTPKTRRVKLRSGIGRVTFAAAVPARVTAKDPLVLSLRARKRRVRSVSYRVGRHGGGRSRRAPYRVAVKPKALQVGGTQQLAAVVAPKKKGAKARRVTMRLNVAECPSLLTAGLRFSGARAVTQVRVFSRTSIRSGTVTVPAKLMPAKLKRGKRAGTLTITGLNGRPVSKSLVAASGGRLLARAGISVRRRSARKVTFSGIPAGTGIVQLDLFGSRRPALKLLRGKKPLRFSAQVRAAAQPVQRLLATIKPSRPRPRPR
jgi:hypothetical protein